MRWFEKAGRLKSRLSSKSYDRRISSANTALPKQLKSTFHMVDPLSSAAILYNTSLSILKTSSNNWGSRHIGQPSPMVSFSPNDRSIINKHACSYLSLDLNLRVKNHRTPHVNITLQEFCDALNDPSRIYNILDMPAISPSHPSLILYEIQ